MIGMTRVVMPNLANTKFNLGKQQFLLLIFFVVFG